MLALNMHDSLRALHNIPCNWRCTSFVWIQYQLCYTKTSWHAKSRWNLMKLIFKWFRKKKFVNSAHRLIYDCDSAKHLSLRLGSRQWIFVFRSVILFVTAPFKINLEDYQPFCSSFLSSVSHFQEVPSMHHKAPPLIWQFSMWYPC